jgi:hypothetical protein
MQVQVQRQRRRHEFRVWTSMCTVLGHEIPLGPGPSLTRSISLSPWTCPARPIIRSTTRTMQSLVASSRLTPIHPAGLDPGPPPHARTHADRAANSETDRARQHEAPAAFPRPARCRPRAPARPRATPGELAIVSAGKFFNVVRT